MLELILKLMWGGAAAAVLASLVVAAGMSADSEVIVWSGVKALLVIFAFMTLLAGVLKLMQRFER